MKFKIKHIKSDVASLTDEYKLIVYEEDSLSLINITDKTYEVIKYLQEGKREKELIKYTHWLWKQRFAELVQKIGMDGIVKKYLIKCDG